MKQDIEDNFSQPWEIYRVGTHKLGGLHLVADMSTKYSTAQLFDFLEVLDVYDAVAKEAAEEATKNKK